MTRALGGDSIRRPQEEIVAAGTVENAADLRVAPDDNVEDQVIAHNEHPVSKPPEASIARPAAGSRE